MVYSFEVRGVNMGITNFLVCIMVCLLLKELAKKKGIDQWLVYEPS